MNLRCQSFVSGITTRPQSECFPGSPQLPVPSPGLHGGWVIRPGTHPLWVLVSPDCWGCFEAAKFRAFCGRQVWVLSTRSRPALRLGFSIHSERKNSRKLRAFLNLPSRHFPPEGPGSSRSRTHTHYPDPSPQPARQPPASALQSSAAAIGPSRRGGVGRSARPSASPGPGTTAIGCGIHQSRVGASRPAGPTRGWPRPRPAPPPSGAGSPQPRGPPHSLSRSMNCQSAPGGC